MNCDCVIRTEQSCASVINRKHLIEKEMAAKNVKLRRNVAI